MEIQNLFPFILVMGGIGLKRFKLLLLTATPFIIGYLISLAMIKFNWYGIKILIISLLFSVYWFWIGYKSHDYAKTAKESLLLGNSFAITNIIFLLIQGPIYEGGFIFYLVVFAPQMFYLPILGLASLIQRNLLFFVSTHYMIDTFIFSCILMIAIYYMGYLMKLRKR